MPAGGAQSSITAVKLPPPATSGSTFGSDIAAKSGLTRALAAVGTPDANGAPANSTGFVKIAVVADLPPVVVSGTITDVRSLETPYPLAPGETIHGITRERITLPGDIGGWLEGRSRFARLGLMIHVTSGFVQPGVATRQVLEMSNVSGRTLLIHAGVRLLQIVLQRCEGSAVYQGRFARQDNL